MTRDRFLNSIRHNFRESEWPEVVRTLDMLLAEQEDELIGQLSGGCDCEQCDDVGRLTPRDLRDHPENGRTEMF